MVTPPKNNIVSVENNIDITENNIVLGKNNIDIGKNNIEMTKNNIDIGKNNIEMSKNNIDIGENNIVPDKNNIVFGASYILKRRFYTQFSTITSNHTFCILRLSVQILYLCRKQANVYTVFRLKRVHIAGYIQVIIIGGNVCKGSPLAVFRFLQTVTVRVHNLINVSIPQIILLLRLFKVLAGIYK